ncbi:MAG: lytic transglycosylase domain-containing protein [Alphaproteobacteria bacterium]|nr:lytic transglycosylase domain-containing protein [Alphaproteobacteria bacterium]
MHRKLLIAGLAGISAASLAAVTVKVRPLKVAAVLPAAMQAVGAATGGPLLPVAPAAPAYGVSPGVAAALAQWNALRQSDSNSFSAYASFLLSHQGWPGESALRKAAEKAINPDGDSAAQVLGFFRVFPPTTTVGQARYAFALYATGQQDKAREAARTAWTGGVLPQGDESRILTLFGGSLTSADHDARLDALLSNGDRQAAQRMLPLASAANRPLFDARLGLQANAADAGARLSALPGDANANAGLLRDKAEWLRDARQASAARALLANRPPLAVRPAVPEKWFETMLTLARDAAADRQWSLAYDIASKIDDAYPAGTDVSERPYGERDDYTSLAWLGGFVALNKLGRPAEATRLFLRYAGGARSQQTRAKGYYWAGRAAAAAGDASAAEGYFREAAASPDQYYGQLAIEKLGRPIPPPEPAAVSVDPGARAQFQARSLVQAAKALGQMGRYADQTLFVRAIAQSAATDGERVLAADLARSLGRLDLGVWVAREARTKGATFYARPGFPDVPLEPGWSRYWSLAQAITRQESSFDRQAVSHAGALGMMQLMPGTANETARKMGLPYSRGRLTSDPSYNMTLGTGYFSTILDQWGGNVPLAVASYNAGAGNVRKWVAQNGDPRLPGTDMVRWIEEIPFQETRNYVQRVLENAVVYDTFAPQGGGTSGRLSFYLNRSFGSAPVPTYSSAAPAPAP